jgi:hypothetical protein
MQKHEFYVFFPHALPLQQFHCQRLSGNMIGWNDAKCGRKKKKKKYIQDRYKLTQLYIRSKD